MKKTTPIITSGETPQKILFSAKKINIRLKDNTAGNIMRITKGTFE